MSKDLRKKGCPNVDCERHTKKIRLHSSEQFCPLCGSSLVYVCPKCFSEISDRGPEHKLCLRCEEEAYQKKKDFGDKAKKVASAIGAAATSFGAVFVASAKNEAVNTAIKAAKKGGRELVKGAIKAIKFL